jgi:Predicted acetyltransferase
LRLGITEGNIDFYGKSGFDVASKFGIKYHGLPEGMEADFFLCKELKPGYLDGISGVYATPKAYFVAEENPEDFEAYEKEFNLKNPLVKQKLPDQLE